MAKADKKTTAITKQQTGLGKVDSLDPQHLSQLLGGQKIDAQVVSLKEPGELIAGWFVGPGDGVDTTDQVTGEIRELPTWEFEIQDGVTIALVGAHQTNKRLEKTAAGTFLTIIRGEQKRVGSKVVNQFLIAENAELSKVGK